MTISSELAARLRLEHPYWEAHASGLTGSGPSDAMLELMRMAFNEGEVQGASDERERHRKTWKDFEWSAVNCVHGSTVCGTCLEQFGQIYGPLKKRIAELEKENKELLLEISDL